MGKSRAGGGGFEIPRMPNQNGREERGGQVRDEKASEGSFLLIFGFLFPLPFVDVVVTHPAPYSPSLSLRPSTPLLLALWALSRQPACLLTPSLVQG